MFSAFFSIYTLEAEISLSKKKRLVMAEKRSKTWATIIYDDLAVSQLQQLKYPCLISPLHDSDVDEDGVLKKAHRHVLFRFSSLKSRKQIEEICSLISGVGVELVSDFNSYALYLTHKNAPEKVQYSPNDVISHLLDYREILSRTVSSFSGLEEILSLADSKQISSFRQLVIEVRKSNPELLPLLASRAYFLKLYLGG